MIDLSLSLILSGAARDNCRTESVARLDPADEPASAGPLKRSLELGRPEGACNKWCVSPSPATHKAQPFGVCPFETDAHREKSAVNWQSNDQHKLVWQQ